MLFFFLPPPALTVPLFDRSDPTPRRCARVLQRLSRLLCPRGANLLLPLTPFWTCFPPHYFPLLALRTHASTFFSPVFFSFPTSVVFVDLFPLCWTGNDTCFRVDEPFSPPFSVRSLFFAMWFGHVALLFRFRLFPRRPSLFLPFFLGFFPLSSFPLFTRVVAGFCFLVDIVPSHLFFRDRP